ncbi:MAG: radical SAM protein [Myxococcota bacterium]|nr:radical SAM protein [Myxococcota bacterium]
MPASLLARLLARRPTGGAAAAPEPPVDLQPAVEWQVCGICNYDCSYCIQSRRHRQGQPSAELVRGIVGGLSRLPGVWEIKLSGGEPFAFPGLLPWVLTGLIERTSHAVSVLTNLSAPAPQIADFCRIAGARLRVFSCSLHLERVTIADFVAKARRCREQLARSAPDAVFVVNSVVVPGRVREQFAVRAALHEAGLGYFPQIMKTKGGIFPYSELEAPLVQELVGDWRQAANRVPSFTGAFCEAGAWYFIIDWQGEAYRCRSGKRLGPEREAAGLGNLAQGTFARWAHGAPCPYAYCPCTVPAHRGMVRGPDGRPLPGTVSHPGPEEFPEAPARTRAALAAAPGDGGSG